MAGRPPSPAASLLDPAATFARVVADARRAVQADAAVVWWPEHPGAPPRVRAQVGCRAADVEPAPALARARTLRDSEHGALPWVAPEGVRWIVGAPLAGGGVLAAFGRRGRPPAHAAARLRALTRAAAPALQTAAYIGQLRARAEGVATLAAENAQLHRQAQSALAELQTAQQQLVKGATLRALSELAGGAAHHLNNLLTIIVGRVQLLLRTVDDERLGRPLAIVEKAAKDGAEVVRRLQQFARTRRSDESRLVNVADVVRDVLEMTRPRWEHAPRADGTRIDVDARLQPVPPLAGDPIELRELLANVIANALEAMPTGGRLTVTTAVADGTVVVTVADTGSGMPESVRRRAHEPFFTTKGVKAVGLGLSVAYGIARRHGGDLTLASEEGRGTIVTLRLPAVAAAPEPGASRAAPLRVLLVDDEPEVRDALADMLAAQGHTVVPATSGAEALAIVEADPALDVVLTDLAMPGTTGLQVAAGTKARRPHVVVGIITGLGDVMAPAGPEGVDFLVEKPVSLAALNAVLASARKR